ncbi:MAG TPA: chemotaxis response regulator protein-glutamate methylesterase [Thermotogota bacterium]|nr:chemotaxis response regulator protein-glutamate methylesterase [Thermotogota bacterium]HPJ87558.1 chemotaxis response regulator protein-glutamate methylesterase [Thermotogota bacterium]HPR94763.1 chemotaxis response regulator protein-glutamate methylesterase [Thermotogota bacterium]
MKNKKIKIIIIDDSVVVRKTVSDIINREPDMEVIATAKDPYEGRDKIVYLNPDVLILDIEMPKMDGLTFLGKLMKSKPMPVIIFSSLAKDRSKYEYTAFDLGAVGVIEKPLNKESASDIYEEMFDLIRTSSGLTQIQLRALERRIIQKNVTIKELSKNFLLTKPVIAIGASTGGTHAIRKIISRLPEKMPPIVMTQHMPKNFTTQFASNLNSCSQLTVLEAQGGEQLKNGIVYLSPGGMHMQIEKKGAFYYTKIVDGPLVHHQKPAVEVLFNSIAEVMKKDAVGILLTGMGVDGAEGLLNMRRNGAFTIAQNEQSCVVFGMPKEAIKLEAADRILDINEIPDFLVKYLEGING